MNLVQLNNDELVVSSLVIAENVNYEHETVIRLIRDNRNELEEFGTLRFENGTLKDSLNRIQSRTIALLNENQTMLIMTLMRNNEIIKKFKVALIKAFSKMKEQIQNNFKVPKTYAEALMIAAQQAQRLEELTKEAEEAKPYIAFAKTAEASKASCLIGHFAKILADKNVKIGEKKLFEWLRVNKYLTKTKYGDNIPYQTYITNGYFELIPRIIPRTQGSQERFTTYITTLGQVKLTNKLLKEFQS